MNVLVISSKNFSDIGINIPLVMNVMNPLVPKKCRKFLNYLRKC
jgi:hypothetical protein